MVAPTVDIIANPASGRDVRDMSSQFEHLPLVDMPLLRDFAPSYLDWLAHPSYDDYWRAIAHRE